MTDGRSAPKPRASAETLAEARRLYEATELTQAAIARRLGLHGSSLSRISTREGWLRPQEAERRRKLLADVRAKVDSEMAASAHLFGQERLAGDEAGRAARTLTSLVRALRELAKHDEERARASGREDADDACPDIDAFRREIADRLDRLRRAGP